MGIPTVQTYSFCYQCNPLCASLVTRSLPIQHLCSCSERVRAPPCTVLDQAIWVARFVVPARAAGHACMLRACARSDGHDRYSLSRPIAGSMGTRRMRIPMLLLLGCGASSSLTCMHGATCCAFARLCLRFCSVDRAPRRLSSAGLAHHLAACDDDDDPLCASLCAHL